MRCSRPEEIPDAFPPLLAHILVVDLEATCDDAGTIPKTEMETIEIGAVMIRMPDYKFVDEYSSFIRPIRHPKLTPFCTRLTSIMQKQIEAARGFVNVAAEFKTWIHKFEDVSWGSWGDFDRKQFELDCERHRVANPMPHRHTDLKKQFSASQKLTKKFGMAKALKYIGLVLYGTHHRGIDDARNIARLLPYVYGEPRMAIPDTDRARAREIPDAEFRRVLAKIVKEYGSTFEALAAHDRGEIDLLAEPAIPSPKKNRK